MTEAKANEIFRSKYPEGEILRKYSTSAENKYWVRFNNTGKVYYYSGSSYQEVLNRLGFNILYKHNVKTINNRITELQTKIDTGYENSLHLFSLEGDKHIFSPQELDTMRREIEELKQCLNLAIIC